MEKENYSIKVLSHIKIENHIEYLINISEEKSGSNSFFPEKYSTLRSLYELMKKESKVKKFPSFPPNKLFGYEEESFVIQRAKDLNAFFQEIISDQNYNKLPSFKTFVESNLQKNSIIKNTGENNSKKNNIIKINTVTHNFRFKKRAILFKNSFYKEDKEAKKDFVEDKREEKSILKKFVKIDYEIDIHSNQKTEEGYQNIFNIINFRDNINNKISGNTNDNNFDLIGKNDDNIIMTEKNIDSYMKKNLQKFKMMSNLIMPENLLLK